MLHGDRRFKEQTAHTLFLSHPVLSAVLVQNTGAASNNSIGVVTTASRVFLFAATVGVSTQEQNSGPSSCVHLGMAGLFSPFFSTVVFTREKAMVGDGWSRQNSLKASVGCVLQGVG